MKCQLHSKHLSFKKQFHKFEERWIQIVLVFLPQRLWKSLLFEFLLKKKEKKPKLKKKQPNTTPKNDKRTLYIVMLKTVFLVHKCTWYIFLETEVFRPNICNTKNTLHAVHICLHCINTLWGKYSRPPESRADFVIRKYIVRWSKLVWKVYLFRI